MSRPLTGSITKRGSTFEASLPVRRGSRDRVQRCFTSEADARAWLDVAVAAVLAGDPVPEPVRTPVRPAAGTGWLEAAAQAWHSEYYALGNRGGPKRRDDVWRKLRLHVLPYLTARAPGPDGFTRAAVLDLVLVLAGRDEAPLAVERTAELAGTTPGRLLGRLRAAGVEPDERDGTGWVTLGDVRRATGKELRIGLSVAVAAEILWSLRRIEEHAVAAGVLDREVIGTLRAMEPHPAHALRPPTPTTPLKGRREPGALDDVRAVAAHLHVIHQVVLWVICLTGARISEVFGLRVASVRRGSHGRWVLDLEEQAGKPFDVLDDDGRRRKAMRKRELKNPQSVRTVAVPQLLAELLLAYIDVMHTDPQTGEVDPDAALFPGDNSDGEASQAGFRSALEGAIAAAGVTRFTPKCLRSALSTRLKALGVDKVDRQRYLGHEPGEEVIDEHYTNDLPDGGHTVPTADTLDGFLAGRELTTLRVPTGRLPLFRRDNPRRARTGTLTDALVALGWLIPPSDDGEVTLDASEVAAELDVSVTHARRLMGTRIPAVAGPRGEKRARLADVEAYRASLGLSVEDLAAELGWDYHRTLRTLHRLVPDLGTRAEDRRVEVLPEHAETLRAEARRIEALHERAVPLTTAAKEILSRAPTTVRGWLQRGELTADPETDTSRQPFLTLESLQAHPECPRGAVEAWCRARGTA